MYQNNENKFTHKVTTHIGTTTKILNESVSNNGWRSRRSGGLSIESQSSLGMVSGWTTECRELCTPPTGHACPLTCALFLHAPQRTSRSLAAQDIFWRSPRHPLSAQIRLRHCNHNNTPALKLEIISKFLHTFLLEIYALWYVNENWFAAVRRTYKSETFLPTKLLHFSRERRTSGSSLWPIRLNVT